MCSSDTDLIHQLAFVISLSELTGSPICCLVKEVKTDKTVSYVSKGLYCKLPNGKVLTLQGYTTEDKLFEQRNYSFLFSGFDEGILADTLKINIAEDTYLKLKQNFKEAIKDIYLNSIEEDTQL